MKNFRLLQLLVLSTLFFQLSCEKDEECSKQTYYQDSDGDGYGNVEMTIESCDVPQGYVQNDLDCDDENPELNPDFPLSVWFRDFDGDGFGDENEQLENCQQPEGYVDNSIDCDDRNANINPSEVEMPGNNIDENCDGLFGIPGNIGNKWYYEGHDRIEDPWNTSSLNTKYIEECVEILIINSIPHYRVRGLKMKEGEDDLVYYRNYKAELDPEDFEYIYTQAIFNREITLYENVDVVLGSEYFHNIYSTDFGYIKYQFNFSDEYVRVENKYSLKGCIIDGVEFGNVSQL